jgi:type VI secretion system secreted protein Hcp
MAIYMKFGKIQGDATQSGYDGWINIRSFNWGLTRNFAPDQVGRSFNREAAQAQIAQCTVTKDADASSGDIMKAAATEFKGQDCQIVFVRTGNPGEAYLSFTLSDAVVANLDVYTQGGERPIESIMIDFTKLKIECKTLDEANVNEDNMIITYDAATGIGG